MELTWTVRKLISVYLNVGEKGYVMRQSVISCGHTHKLFEESKMNEAIAEFVFRLF